MSMSIRQFAKEFGVSHEAIRKAIKKEIIPPEAMGVITSGTRTMPIIENVELAAKCYRAGTRHSKGHQAGRSRSPNLEIGRMRFIGETFRTKYDQARYEEKMRLLVPRSKIMVAIHAAREELKKIVPSKHRKALEKILQTLKDAVDPQNKNGSS